MPRPLLPSEDAQPAEAKPRRQIDPEDLYPWTGPRPERPRISPELIRWLRYNHPCDVRRFPGKGGGLPSHSPEHLWFEAGQQDVVQQITDLYERQINGG
jgi:hypothetical protein